jgi:hypothetical protein
MDSAWSAQLFGRTVEAIEQPDHRGCVVVLSDGYAVQIECLWRLLTEHGVALTSRDDGELFGRHAPVRAIPELLSALRGLAITSVQVAHRTGDLTIGFEGVSLQVIAESSGYEAWQVHGPLGTLAIGQGGGRVVGPA